MSGSYNNLPPRPEPSRNAYRSSRYDIDEMDPHDYRRPEYHRRSESDSYRYRSDWRDESPPRRYDPPRGPRLETYRDRSSAAPGINCHSPNFPPRPANSSEPSGLKAPKKQKLASKPRLALSIRSTGAKKSPNGSPTTESPTGPTRSLASRITKPSPATSAAASPRIPASDSPRMPKSGSPLAESRRISISSAISAQKSVTAEPATTATPTSTASAAATPNASSSTPSTPHPESSASMQNSGEPPAKRRRELPAPPNNTNAPKPKDKDPPPSKNLLQLECDVVLSSITDYIRACLHQGQVSKLLSKANQELEKHVSRHPEIRAQAELPRHRIAMLEKQLAEAENSAKKFRDVTEDVVPALFRRFQQASGLEKTDASVAKLEAKVEQQASVLSQQEQQIKSLEARDKTRADMMTRLEARLKALENSQSAAAASSSAAKSRESANRVSQPSPENQNANVAALKVLQADLESMKRITMRIEAKFGVVSKRSEADSGRISQLSDDVRDLKDIARSRKDHNGSGGGDGGMTRKAEEDLYSLKKSFTTYQSDQGKIVDSLRRDYTGAVVKLARIQANYIGIADNLSQQTLGLETVREDLDKLQTEYQRLSDNLDTLKSVTTSDEARHTDHIDNLKTGLDATTKTLQELSAKLDVVSSGPVGAGTTTAGAGSDGADAVPMEQSHIKTLKSVVKKMKKLEETQDFVVSSWGAQLDDLRQELPTLVAESVANSLPANALASASAPAPAPRPAVTGPTNEEVAGEVATIKAHVDSTQAKMDDLEKQMSAMSQLLETVQAQFRAIRTDEVYDSIVEHLELWHPTSTRAVLDELRSKLDEYETRLKMVVPASAAQDIDYQPLAKKRRLEGTAVETPT